MNFKTLIKRPDAYAKVACLKVINLMRSKIYKGNAVVCDICKWKGKQFFKGKCPNCNSLPRTRLIPFSLRHFKIIEGELKILHIAPNLNEYHYILNNFVAIKKYDRLNIKRVFPHINLVQDITKSDIKDETYDLVIVWHVFEHIVEDVSAALEIYRILKPNGNLLMSVPIYPVRSETTFEDSSIKYEDYEEIHGHDDHCRSCGLDYYKRFETVGFNTKTLMNYSENEIKQFGLSKNHVAWCFNKKE